MDKFGRNYILTIQTPDGADLIIQPPFTVEFDITRNILTSANVCSIKVFNLSENNRNKIRKDARDLNDIRSISLRAGYGTNLSVIFNGNISQAWSVREGVNFITTVECFDGGPAFVDAQVNQVFPSGTPIVAVLKSLVGMLPGVSLGAIGNYPGALTRDIPISGSVIDAINGFSGGGFFIDNGKAYIFGDNECSIGSLTIINSQAGLLNTPVKENLNVTFDIIFEPRLVAGQQLQLMSSTDKTFNGIYKVISLKHRGMISQAVCGDAVTSVGVSQWVGALTTVQDVSA